MKTILTESIKKSLCLVWDCEFALHYVRDLGFEKVMWLSLSYDSQTVNHDHHKPSTVFYVKLKQMSWQLEES